VIALWFAGPAATPAHAQVKRYISDMSWDVAVSGWGPAERDRSNGELGADDGHTLTIEGVKYLKGVGIHANSQITVSPARSRCTEFHAVIGVDDEVGDAGSVTFQVIGDNTLLYQSPELTGSSPGVPVSLAVGGYSQLRLNVIPGASAAFDHADWADAYMNCAGSLNTQLGPAASLPALTNTHGVRVVDLNRDGRLDLLAANAGSNAASVWLGNLGAGFGARLDFATGPEPKAAVTGDFNRDGRPDLVTANQAGASVSVLLATATQFGYGAAVDYAACTGAHEPAVGDFTGDDIVDVIVACWGGNVVSLLRGIGNGTLAAPVNVTAGAAPHSVITGDFNRDGQLDAAIANHDGASISVLIGRGNGTFDTHVDYAVGSGPHSIRTGDLNGDGNLDLAVANDASSTISVLRGLGNGTFAAAANYPTGPGPKGVAIADVNGDGLLDLLSANTAGNYPVCCNPGGDTISLLLNGGSTFQAAQSITVGLTPFAVAAGDFDGDGGIDVVTANWHSNDVTILRNGGATFGGYLSDMPWTSMSNGWGPAERDRSNGELGDSDGGPIRLDGVTYARGIGVHADSQIFWPLNGQCTSFTAVIGVDDEVGSNGSVIFQVYVDGQMRYMSPTLTGSSPALPIQVDISGGSEIGLFVHYGWDDYGFDHADWANAQIQCTP
jgi:hypothetical protein